MEYIQHGADVLFVLQVLPHLPLPTIWNAYSMPNTPREHEHVLENHKRLPYRAIITNVTGSYSSGMLDYK